MVIFYFLFAFLFTFNGFFRGVGDAKIAMIFPAISLTIRTVSAYILVGFFDMGPEALAWSIPMGWVVSSIASWVYYKKRLWVGKVAT
jgi:Na+-driven multidrug efflux pump